MDRTDSETFIRPEGESWGGRVYMFNYFHWAKEIEAETG